MEARQRINPPVDTRCCSKIEVVVADRDKYPGTVSLEVDLFNSMAPGKRFARLGTARVDSDTSAERTVSFPFFAAGSLKKFDEIRVVFHLDRLRAERSARIAIERFVLVP